MCEHIINQLDNHRVDRISLDSFYLPLTPDQLEHVSEYNWDHPAALDWDLIVRYVTCVMCAVWPSTDCPQHHCQTR